VSAQPDNLVELDLDDEPTATRRDRLDDLIRRQERDTDRIVAELVGLRTSIRDDVGSLVTAMRDDNRELRTSIRDARAIDGRTVAFILAAIVALAGGSLYLRAPGFTAGTGAAIPASTSQEP
jgi:hypothetical protein